MRLAVSFASRNSRVVSAKQRHKAEMRRTGGRSKVEEDTGYPIEFVLVVKLDSPPVLICCAMRWSSTSESNFTSGKVQELR